MRQHAFTLSELLLVVGIISLTAAIATPAFLSARESAKRSVCVENLKTLYESTALYRADYEGISYGSAEQMGLPTGPSGANFVSQLMKKTKCPDRRPDPEIGISYLTMFSSSDYWSSWASKLEDRTVIYVDAFHNPLDIPLTNDNYVQRFVMAIDLGGTLRKKNAMGDWEQFSWWLP